MRRRDLRGLPLQLLERLNSSFGDGFTDTRHRGFDIDYKGQTLEHRANRGVELRLSDAGEPIIQGYATVYDHPYEVFGGAPYGWTETIVGGAAAKSIAERDGVFLFFDHAGLPLSFTGNGTLTLASDKIGLYNESRADPQSPYSMEIVRRIERGDLDSMSFAFQATRQEWNADYTERFITELKLFDVSVVSFPANPATVVQVRATERILEVGMPLGLAQRLADASRSRVA